MGPEYPSYKQKRPRPIWERGPLDTDQSWPYFVAYRNITSGARTLARIKNEPSNDVKRPVLRGESPTLEKLSQWYLDQSWHDRVQAYDTHMDSVFQEEREALARLGGRKLAAEQMALLQTGKDAVEIELEKLLALARDSEHAALKPGELVKLMETVLKYQRLVAGESTEVIEERSDLSDMSDEELAIRLSDLRSKKAKI